MTVDFASNLYRSYYISNDRLTKVMYFFLPPQPRGDIPDEKSKPIVLKRRPNRSERNR